MAMHEDGGPEDEHLAFKEVFTMGPVLGTGGFSSVRHAVRRVDGKAYAVKIVRVPNRGENCAALRDHVKQEIRVLRGISHPSIVSLKDVYRQGATFYLVTDLCSGGELLAELLVGPKYSEAEARKVMWGLAKGVGYLHSKGIVHRDLKLENFLIVNRNDRTTVKIADFGLAVKNKTKTKLTTSSISGSALYIAPELLLASEAPGHRWYDERVDLWSLGVSLYLLLSRAVPFSAPTLSELFAKIKKGDFVFPEESFAGISDAAKDLISRLLVTDPDQRISLADALRHDFFAEERASPGAGAAAELEVPLGGKLARGERSASEPNFSQTLEERAEDRKWEEAGGAGAEENGEAWAAAIEHCAGTNEAAVDASGGSEHGLAAPGARAAGMPPSSRSASLQEEGGVGGSMRGKGGDQRSGGASFRWSRWVGRLTAHLIGDKRGGKGDIACHGSRSARGHRASDPPRQAHQARRGI